MNSWLQNTYAGYSILWQKGGIYWQIHCLSKKFVISMLFDLFITNILRHFNGQFQHASFPQLINFGQFEQIIVHQCSRLALIGKDAGATSYASAYSKLDCNFDHWKWIKLQIDLSLKKKATILTFITKIKYLNIDLMFTFTLQLSILYHYSCP